MRSKQAPRCTFCRRAIASGLATFAAILFGAAFLPLVSIAQTTVQSPQPAGWSSVVLAASKERRIVLYANLVPPLLERLKIDFEQTNPSVMLEYHRIVVQSELFSRIEHERKIGADGADVVITSEIGWVTDRSKEAAFKTPFGPSARSWPSAYLIGDRAPILALYPFVMAYNSNLIKTEITGYRDLLKPELKGRIGTSLPVAGVLVAWYDWLEKTQGPDFLVKFGAQSPRAYTGAFPATQAVAAGEIAVTAFSTFLIAQPLIDQGAPIKVVVPKPSLGNAVAGGALTWSKRPNAAIVFMDYLMSRRGQTVISGKGETASPLPGIPGSLDATTIIAPDLAPYTVEAVKLYGEKWNKIFRRQ